MGKCALCCGGHENNVLIPKTPGKALGPRSLLSPSHPSTTSNPEGPPLNLYLLAYTTDDGDSMDFFVQAESPQEALGLYLAEGMVEDMLDGYFEGRLIEADELTLPKTGADVLRIFQISTTPDVFGVLPWDATGAAGGAVLVAFIYA